MANWKDRRHQRPKSVSPRPRDLAGWGDEEWKALIPTRRLMRERFEKASPMMRRARMRVAVAAEVARVRRLVELDAPSLLVDHQRRLLWEKVERFNETSRALHLPLLVSKLRAAK